MILIVFKLVDQPEGQRREPTPLNPPIDGLDDNLQQNSDNCDDILVLNANTQIVRNTQIAGLINSNEFVAGFVEIKMVGIGYQFLLVSTNIKRNIRVVE